MPALPLGSADRLFLLTGAGMSAESGIPTFRDAGGLWRKYRIEEVASPHAWRRDPHLVWGFYSMRRRIASAAKPNPGHFALATLERVLQDRFFLCTQNVDNLHEVAGSQRVLHMHGELFKSRCDTCTKPPFEDTNLLNRPRISPAVSVADSFVRTSAGSVKLPSFSIAFSKRSANARYSLLLALLAQLSPPPALSRLSLLAPELFMPVRKLRPTVPSSMIAFSESPASFFPNSLCWLGSPVFSSLHLFLTPTHLFLDDNFYKSLS